MPPKAPKLDPRAQHLLAASQLFARSQPELNSYFGAQLAEHINQLPNAERPQLQHPLCLACGRVQAPGLGCDVVVQTRRPRRKPKTPSKMSKLTSAGSGKLQTQHGGQQKQLEIHSTLKRTCRSCRRYTISSLQKPGKLKQPSETAISSRQPVKLVGQGKSSKPEVNQDSTGEAVITKQKARKKQKNGSLAAILATQNKARQEAASSSSSFGFGDFVQKR